ncbi:hypothetical protein [Vibrio sp. SCSIO 43136]|uniref:hypothetical protein n=1 Tax=Vibrio sp. SCSIO 43136 TaxID=2819101 RepID=UPI0020757BDB|nr:hypothetical protein [Vibrio sp. SCSIO 43136]USD64213.1 hypothetical protein J4N39_08825 [Vibrio sp. SCSIO 43136]
MNIDLTENIDKWVDITGAIKAVDTAVISAMYAKGTGYIQLALRSSAPDEFDLGDARLVAEEKSPLCFLRVTGETGKKLYARLPFCNPQHKAVIHFNASAYV